MILKLNRAWFAAFGASVMMMAAHAHGFVQKPVSKTSATTLTGCLRMDGKQFELTNPKGSAVRTSRSWKSGFIRKTPRNVEVVSASANVKLQDHVGRVVSVVGTQSDGTHLRASSIKRIATSCAS